MKDIPCFKWNGRQRSKDAASGHWGWGKGCKVSGPSAVQTVMRQKQTKQKNIINVTVGSLLGLKNNIIL